MHKHTCACTQKGCICACRLVCTSVHMNVDPQKISPPFFLRQNLLLGTGTCQSCWPASARVLPASTFLELGLQTYTTVSYFLHGFWGSNSGVPTWMASTSLTSYLHSQPPFFSFNLLVLIRHPLDPSSLYHSS